MDTSTDPERPYIDLYFDGLIEIADAHSNDVVVLYDVLSEAYARVAKNESSKSTKVISEIEPRFHELVGHQFPPAPDAVPGARSFGNDSDWPQVGLLKAAGYSVGAKDPGRAQRRTVLTAVFRGPIPRVHDIGYMAMWGADESLDRLLKMAWSITTFANNRLRQLDGVDDDAVAAWREDRAWLKSEFYDGVYSFPWPPRIG